MTDSYDVTHEPSTTAPPPSTCLNGDQLDAALICLVIHPDHAVSLWIADELGMDAAARALGTIQEQLARVAADGPPQGVASPHD